MTGIINPLGAIFRICEALSIDGTRVNSVVLKLDRTTAEIIVAGRTYRFEDHSAACVAVINALRLESTGSGVQITIQKDEAGFDCSYEIRDYLFTDKAEALAAGIKNLSVVVVE